MVMFRLRLLFFQFVLASCVFAKNNVCKSFSDYWYHDLDKNENCTYNPDMYLDSPQILEKYFGKYEVHEIPTEDGYFVTTFRVPRNNSRGTILFRHIATSDAIIWLGFGKDSIAYYYWQRGYELWLTNTRGTDYSTKHVNLTINDYAFWNFSFHEIGIYDLRASLKYIYEFNNNTSPAIIANSMGCTEALIYASLFPEEAKKLCKIYILHAPPSSFQYSPLKFLGFYRRYWDYSAKEEKLGDIFRRNGTISRVMHSLCPKKPDLCITLFSAFGAGWSQHEPDPLLAPVMFMQNPRSLSTKALSHYAQSFISGKFTMFDYGEKNFEVYGRHEPPEYPVWKIVAPIYLVHSPADYLAPKGDTDDLYDKLTKSAKIYGRLVVEGMNHIDTFLAKLRNEKIHYKNTEVPGNSTEIYLTLTTQVASARTTAEDNFHTAVQR
ncbi:lipase member K-like [Coccinella septempunctata]|uniref:lipase member K-like n=1 Tax=Coccinella septempunctata TaxID=41139 RepID=UPI001D08828D|nr:lipase member K-like [Coccinella septempunctata]